MRILYPGNFADRFCTERWVANAFERLGHTVRRVSVADTGQSAIVQLAASESFDLLLGANFMFREASGPWPGAAYNVVRMIEAVRPHVPKVVCWLWDLMCPEFSPPRWEWSKIIAPAVDLFAMTDGYSAAQLPNAVVIRDGCPDDVDQECEWAPPIVGDVLFLGTVYGDRRNLFDAFGRRFGSRFRVVNNVRGTALTRLVRSYRVLLGPHYPRFPHYWSDRLTVVTGHGGLFAGPTIEGMDADGWKPGENYIPLTREPENMAEQVAECLMGDMDAIRLAGFRHAQDDCTWDRRVQELLSRLEEKQCR